MQWTPLLRVLAASFSVRYERLGSWRAYHCASCVTDLFCVSFFSLGCWEVVGDLDRNGYVRSRTCVGKYWQGKVGAGLRL